MNMIKLLATSPDTISPMISIVIMVGMLVLMYVFMIGPQKKKEKADAAMRENLMVGDEITTIGGIIGRVVSIKDETCVIETSRDCTRLRILKTAIRSVDVPVSATKGYVAPVEKEETVENTAEEKTETVKKAKKK